MSEYKRFGYSQTANVQNSEMTSTKEHSIKLACISAVLLIVQFYSSLPNVDAAGFEQCASTCSKTKDCGGCAKNISRSVTSTCAEGSCSHCIRLDAKNPKRCDKKKEILPCCAESNGGQGVCMEKTVKQKVIKNFECRPLFESCLNKPCKTEADCKCEFSKKQTNLIPSCVNGKCSSCVKYGGAFQAQPCAYWSNGKIAKLPCCPYKKLLIECIIQRQDNLIPDPNDPKNYKCLEACVSFVDGRIKRCYDTEGYTSYNAPPAFTSCEVNGNRSLWTECKFGKGEITCGAAGVKCGSEGDFPCCNGYLCENGICDIECPRQGEPCGEAKGRIGCCINKKRKACVNGKCDKFPGT